MSDITKQSAAPATQRVLEWLEAWLARNKTAVGGSMPTEFEIARATGAGRSSVREALTAMKVLGLIESRRKGGIRLLREPALLELRQYFGPRFRDRRQHAEAMEFRAALEWGLGPLMLTRAKDATVRKLHRIVEDVVRCGGPRAMEEGEIRFHTALVATCGNRLAALLTAMYAPIFRDATGWHDVHDMSAYTKVWAREHKALADALTAPGGKRFLRLLRKHTHQYMRGL